MALELTMVQRNDNKLITFTDTGSWDGIATIADISSGELTLTITIQTTSGSAVEYTGIDVYDKFDGPFSTQSDMVYEIDPSMLIVSGGSTALGTDDDVFPDGVYTISYVYDNGIDEASSFSRYVLVDGVVANKVYTLLRSIPAKYECGGPHEKQILSIMYANTYLQAMHASSIMVNVTYILNELETLEDILANGNLYTW